MTTLTTPSVTSSECQSGPVLNEVLLQHERAEDFLKRLLESGYDLPLPELTSFLPVSEKDEYLELKELYEFSEVTADMVTGRMSELLCLGFMGYLQELIRSGYARPSMVTCFRKASS